MTITPTPEQQRALDLFATGASLAIEAGAGAGKTSTLKMLAASAPNRRGQYMAFNKAIVEEAKAKMPPNITASTVHSLAYQAVGKHYRNRLNSARIPSWKLGKLFGFDPFNITVGGKTRTLQPGWFGSLAMSAIGRFCSSADREPSIKHVPVTEGIDDPKGDGSFNGPNNAAVRAIVADTLAWAWDDLTRSDGQLKFEHAHYLKMWELSGPKINADFILYDEAQDASPVMESIVFQQTHAQLVVVGDSNQAIYGWMGAIDSLSRFKAREGTAAATLSQSFRFGQPIADVANVLLAEVGAELVMTGTDSVASVVATVLDDAEVDCFLARTNAGAVTRLLTLQSQGIPAHMLGGGKEVLDFARAAERLMAGQPVSHPELSCFDNWAQVIDYVANDPQGSDLRLLVSLVEKFGTAIITEALSRQAKNGEGVCVSTAHKSKGKEWGIVRIEGDFPEATSAEELRLLYVAATRAQNVLDVHLCEPLATRVALMEVGA